MNETIQAILNRRSTRGFTEEPISNEVLFTLIEAGAFAPSAVNKQPWHFTIIKNKEIIEELNQDTLEMLKVTKHARRRRYSEIPNFNIFYHAPIVILVSREKEIPSSPVDCAAATQNILLAAQSMNLGTCWIGIIEELFLLNPIKTENYIERFNIPRGFYPSHAIALGHKKISYQKAPIRRDGTFQMIE